MNKKLVEKLKRNKNKYIITVLLCMVVILGINTCKVNYELENLKTDPELHDCYICGKEVEISRIDDSYYIECDIFEGGCGLSLDYHSSKQKLADKWNSIGE